jgi:D-threo-aldose 1-dehydrogenase
MRQLPPLGLGCAPLGNLYHPVPEEQALAAVEAAFDTGGTYFDTAPHYGLGLSERRLGRALAGYPRDEYVVSSKVGRLLVPNPRPTGSDLEAGGFDVPDDLVRVRDYSAEGVRRCIEESLERLGLDYLDIVLVHDAEDHMDAALGEAVPALAELRAQGLVRAVGAGMNFVEPLRRFAQLPEVDVLMAAGRWTAVDRGGAPLLAECLERGVSVLAAAPFNSGLLSTAWPKDGAHFNYESVPAPVLAAARRIAAVCQDYGVELPAVAMQFGLRHPAVASVVVGMRTAEHSRTNVRWATAPIPDEIWPAVDAAVQEPVEAQGS